MPCHVLLPGAPPRALSAAAVPAAVRQGAVVRCQGLLQASGWSERIERALQNALAEHAGAHAAQAVARDGIESLHAHVDARQLVAISDALYDALLPHTRALLTDSLGLLGSTARFWFDPRPKVRFHVPHARAEADHEVLAAFARRRGEGKLTLHEPHLDSWHGCPTNAVNLWFSLGRSRTDNGMTVFPELFGRQLAPDGHDVSPTQYYGRGVDTELERGDAWIFAGDHLHTSIVNQSSETRAGVSFRFSFVRPRVAAEEHECFVSSRWDATPLAAPTTRANAVLARARLRVERALRQRRVTLLQTRSKPDVTPPGFLQPLLPGREHDREWAIASSALSAGELRALHAGAIVWRSESGRAYAALRACPHRGADLVAGEVCGEHVVCPWHRLALGAAAPDVPALPRLRMLRCEEQNGVITITRA